MAIQTVDRFDPRFPLMLDGGRLYILARTDIAQMNTGKGWAHGGHVGTQFVFDVLDRDVELLTEEVNNWRQQGGGGFGTKITLALTEAEIRETVAEMSGRYHLQTGLVVDPTYPMFNHFNVPFTREELTAGYVFCPANTPAAALDVLKEFKLHP